MPGAMPLVALRAFSASPAAAARGRIAALPRVPPQGHTRRPPRAAPSLWLRRFGPPLVAGASGRQPHVEPNAPARSVPLWTKERKAKHPPSLILHWWLARSRPPEVIALDAMGQLPIMLAVRAVADVGVPGSLCLWSPVFFHRPPAGWSADDGTEADTRHIGHAGVHALGGMPSEARGRNRLPTRGVRLFVHLASGLPPLPGPGSARLLFTGQTDKDKLAEAIATATRKYGADASSQAPPLVLEGPFTKRHAVIVAQALSEAVRIRRLWGVVPANFSCAARLEPRPPTPSGTGGTAAVPHMLRVFVWPSTYVG